MALCTYCHTETPNLPYKEDIPIASALLMKRPKPRVQENKQKQKQKPCPIAVPPSQMAVQSTRLKVQALCPHPTPNHPADPCPVIFRGYPHTCSFPSPWVFSPHNWLNCIVFLSFSATLNAVTDEGDSGVDKRKPWNIQNVFFLPYKYGI